MANEIEARVVADSISETGCRITTVAVVMPRVVLPQMLTHRMFSRNTQSSRAVPTLRMVTEEPWVPAKFGCNGPGMQSREELDPETTRQAQLVWLEAAESMRQAAKRLHELGVHKQWANRLWEPFAWVRMLITATEWSNFFQLRLNDAAQPEMREVALRIDQARNASEAKLVRVGGWHVPYGDLMPEGLSEADRMRVAVARCARVSYRGHQGEEVEVERDRELHDRLARDRHESPFEHVARCEGDELWYDNLKGWRSLRNLRRWCAGLIWG